jgi:hypothetical protein
MASRPCRVRPTQLGIDEESAWLGEVDDHRTGAKKNRRARNWKRGIVLWQVVGDRTWRTVACWDTTVNKLGPGHG